MNREQRDEAKLRRGENARQVLENQAYREAWMLVRARLVDEISRINTKDSEAMANVVQQLQSLDRVERTLESFYNKGKLVIEKRSKLAKFKNIL